MLANLENLLYLCSVKRKLSILLLFFCIACTVGAETKWDHLERRNEIRIGWGDQLFESLMWHNPTSIATTMPETWQATYKEGYKHCQHLWLEYQWRFTHWFSLGAMVDGSGVSWINVTRNGKGTEISRSGQQYFYNLVFMPTVRFTYFHHPNVNLYSGIGIGMDINGGTETNGYGKHTEVGIAINGTVFGVSANYDRWFMTMDLGGLTALKDANNIYMAFSRMINVSIGARF